MNVIKEMQLLRDKLDEMDIKQVDCSESFGGLEITRTRFLDNEGVEWSAIHGFETMGGYGWTRADKGLLEIWNGKSTEPIGFLTAKEALNIIFKR